MNSETKSVLDIAAQLKLPPEQRTKSLAELTASLPESFRREAFQAINDKEAYELQYDWSFWARPKQLPPGGDWRVWASIAGRGFGKTRTGAEWIRMRVNENKARHIALVNDTSADVRDIMIEGPSGLLAVFPPHQRPVYEPSKRKVTFRNGAAAMVYMAEAPELLRGPEHDAAWADEPAKWKNLLKKDNDDGTAWDNLMMGLRQGNAQCVVTTTPRPTFMRILKKQKNLIVTKGTTFENRLNLSEKWFQDIIGQYEGTRLGRQELHAEELDDVQGALWTRMLIEKYRATKHPELIRIVVAIDPASTSNESSDEAGIIVAGKGTDGHGYILDDMTLRGSPSLWGRTAIAGYYKYFADRIVAETNNGGEMIEILLRTIDANVSYKGVHASRGKTTRAEPVQALYEQGKVHHVGYHAFLEDEMCSWVPWEKSPNRMDALVWAMSELLVHDSRITVRAY